MPKKGQRPEATNRNQYLINQKIKSNPFTPAFFLPGFALISQARLKQYAVRPLHSGQCRNGPSADAGPSLAISVAHSTRIFPDFPHNKRSKNERLLLLNFAFFLLHFAFNQLPLDTTQKTKSNALRTPVNYQKRP